VVFDFGAQSGAPFSHSGRSAAYMAPEQWQRNTPMDAHADIYALGVIAFEMITGRRRAIALSAEGIAIVDPVPLTQDVPLAPGIGLHVNHAILRAVAKRPTARFASAGEFVAMLDIKAQTPVHGLPTQRPALEIPRSRHFALVPMLLVAIVGVVLGVYTTPSVRQLLHESDSFTAITDAFSFRSVHLPETDPSASTNGESPAPASDNSSGGGASSSSQSIFPGAATASGDPGTGGGTATVESPRTSPSGASPSLGGTATEATTRAGALAPEASRDSTAAGILRVEFNGPSALVMVDELPRGLTPYTGRVEPGAHSIRLVGSSADIPIRQIRVFAGDTAFASFSKRATPP
jgi:hypothetical protein